MIASSTTRPLLTVVTPVRVTIALALLLLMAGLLVPSCAVALKFAGSGGWFEQDAGIAAAHGQLRSACFMDAAHGWAVGDSDDGALIMATSDGGAHWSAQDASAGPDTSLLLSVSFANQTHGWAVGGSFRGTVILATKDGGKSWRAQRPADSSEQLSELHSVSFASSSRGWAVGDDYDADGTPYGVINATTDGGATWVSQRKRDDEFLEAVDFVSENQGWAVGCSTLFPMYDHPPLILATTDGGATWRAQDASAAGPYSWLFCVDFVDSMHGWAGGHAGIIATTDGGRSWHLQDTSVLGDATFDSIHFVDANHGWAIGEGQLVATSDGGATWKLQPVATDAGLYSVTFADRRHGWLVGARAAEDARGHGPTTKAPVILATTTGGQSAATRQDLLTSLTRLRNALLAQYDRDIDLTASTYIYTSEFRREAKITEPIAYGVQKLKESLGVFSTVLGATGTNLKQLITGKVANDPQSANRFIQGLSKAEKSAEYRTAGTSAGIAAFIGDVKSVDEFELMPEGFGKISKEADAQRNLYKEDLDRAITVLGGYIAGSDVSPQVPLREVAWASGARPKAARWAAEPNDAKTAIRKLFADLARSIPTQLPEGYDAAEVVDRLETLRKQVVGSGVRRVDFSGIPGLQGPNDTPRKIPLGLIDANWKALSGLETAFLQKLKVRKEQSLKNVEDVGISLISIVITGDPSTAARLEEPVLLSYQLASDFTLVPQQTESAMAALNENEFEMSMYLVEDIANLYEIANCTSSYVKGTLGQQ